MTAVAQAARHQAVSLETAATTEMAAADEAFIQLGDAETNVNAPMFFPYHMMLVFG